MTLSKAPVPLAMLGHLFGVLLLFTSWASARASEEPPLQNISPPSAAEALWLTEDRSLIIASGACAAGSSDLCGVIVGINDPEMKIWAPDICGLPIFWDLKSDAEKNKWRNGRILDLVTLKEHQLSAHITPGWLVLHIKDQTPIHWQETTLSPVGCNF